MVAVGFALSQPWNEPVPAAAEMMAILEGLESEFDRVGACLSGMVLFGILLDREPVNTELTRLLAAKPKTGIWEEARRVLAVCKLAVGKEDPELRTKSAWAIYADQLADAKIPEAHREAKKQMLDYR